MGVITSAVMLGVAAAGTAKSISEGKKAKKASKRANEAQRKINRLRNFQSKRAFMRQFRQQQADVVTAGLAQGIGIGSSTIQGQRASGLTQAGTGAVEFQRMDDLGAEMTKQMNKQASAQFAAGVSSSVASFASSFVDYGEIGGIFKKPG